MATIEVFDVENYPERDEFLIPIKKMEDLKKLAKLYDEPCLLRYGKDVYLIVRGSKLTFYHHERAGD